MRSLSWRRPGRARTFAAAAGLLLVAAVASAPPALAHGQKPGAGQGRIEPALDPLPPALTGIRAQLHESLAPQVVVENPGNLPLVILDELGGPFLRIGPRGVEANLASSTFYRTSSPSDAVPVPQDVIEAGAAKKILPARWRQIAEQPSWGWFDRRIEVEDLEVPHTVIAADATAEVGRFTIPVRIGETDSALEGRFVYRPKARGALRLRMASGRSLVPGVEVSLLPGRGGSFFLRSDLDEPITLLGRDGEPALRFGRDGVHGNLHSATFLELHRLRGSGALRTASTDDGPNWHRLASAPRFGWVDPRALVDVPESVRAGGEARQVADWTLPLEIGSGEAVQRVAIEGTTWWEPLQRGPATESTAKH